MKKKLLLTMVTLSVGLSGLMVGNQASADSQKGKVVNAYHLNMRDKGSNNGKIVAVLSKGETVTVLNGSGSWDYVQYGSKKGYVYDKYIQIIPSSSSAVGAKTGSVTAYQLNLRQQASASSKIIAVLKNSQTVNITGQTGTWYKVTFNGKAGFVHKNYIKVNEQTQTPAPKPEVTKPVVAPPAVTTPITGTSTYKVVKNDTLYKIARQYNISVDNLKEWNNLSSNLIKVGQVLHIKTTADTKPTAPTVSQTLKGKIIVIDPGHGDDRPGAIGNGIVEKTLNYSVSLKVKDRLEARGAKVVFTRVGDTDCNPTGTYDQDLLCRAQLPGKVNADLFLSIHGNSGSASATGAETFYYTASSQRFASAVQQAYVKETGLRDRRTAYANFGVLRNNKVPAALIELGFISNPSEAAQLNSASFQDKAANGIVKGIENYYGK